jgi:uncharacterized cupin superfamily protein
VIAHWGDLEPSHEHEGTIEFDGYDLGEAAGTRDVGVTRAQVRPGKQSSPVHIEVAEEEIFFVLDGSGLSSSTRSARATSCRLPGSGIAHAFRGGEAGMTLLAYGQKIRNEILYYPRSKIYFRGVGVMARLDHLAYEVGEESTV